MRKCGRPSFLREKTLDAKRDDDVIVRLILLQNKRARSNFENYD